jgi:drug/metabolite transporter (DMT)-like permease
MILGAFAIVYLVWGSTYLAMRIAVHTLPPFLLAGVRFSGAGALLLAWSHRRPRPVITRAHWREGAITGLLLLVGGNGAVVWAVQVVPSGLAALMVATVPVWLVLLSWMLEGKRPGWLLTAGLVGGLVGVALLLGPGLVASTSASAAIPPGAGLALVLGSLSWALGSLRARKAPATPGRPFLMSGVQMSIGGAFLLLLGASTGELARLHGATVSFASLAALAYLMVFGSLVAYSAFAWLLQVAPPAQVATYAYVNPVIAVLLGCTLGNEPLSARIVVAAAVILAAVVLVTRGTAVRSPAAPARASR